MYIEEIKFKKILKKIKISNKPFGIFEDDIIDFFNSISKSILKNKNFTKYPDLIAFGFWCRKKNILKIKKNYKEKQVGRGLVFHISPSNIPLNFAFSLAFGLLAGNCNLVRLPSVEFEQVKILFNLINKIISKKNFKHLKSKINLISYNRSDYISKTFSKQSDARMIWGGDKTIQKFKSFETKPRCIDLTFSDRFSISLINCKSYLSLNKIDKNKIVNNFIRDCYTMDQRGCSSPKAVFWVGKISTKHKKNFWSQVNKNLNERNQFDLVKTNKKIYEIQNNIITNLNNFKFNITNFQTIILNLPKGKKNSNIENFQVGYGTFFEININDIKELNKYITEKCQTITQFGFENKKIRETIIKENFRGVDRIVKMGMAFEMSNVWDGYDIINCLSRKISLI